MSQPSSSASATYGAWFGAPPTDAQRTRQRMNRLGSVIGVAIGVVIVGLRIYLGRNTWSDIGPSDLWILFAIVGGFGLLIWAGLAGIAVSGSRRVRATLEARPDSAVFATARTDELVKVLKANQLRHLAPVRIAAAVGPQGIELWAKPASGEPLLVLPWASIDHVQPDHARVPASRYSSEARSVRVFSTIDGGAGIPMPIYGPRNLGFANVARANEVMGWFARYARVEGTDI